MINAGDFKKHMRIEIEGEPYSIVEVRIQSPTARGGSTLVKTKVRSLRTQNLLEKTFKTSDRIEEPQLEMRPVQFLYHDDAGFHFMDTDSYDQFSLGRDELGEAADYLIDGLAGIRSVVFNGKVISIDLPQTVNLEIVETDPVVRGATAQAQTKPAKLASGLTVQVPAYMEPGEVITVDTREARCLGRAK